VVNKTVNGKPLMLLLCMNVATKTLDLPL